MTVRELHIGDVFRVRGEESRWQKISAQRAKRLAAPTGTYMDGVYADYPLGNFVTREIEVVERAPTAEIRVFGRTLILRGGEVTLEYGGAWAVHRVLPGGGFTEIAFTGSSFAACRADRRAADVALLFTITGGSKHFGRPANSELVVYGGRVYGRATQKEVLGKARVGGYKLVRTIDGAKRLVIAGVLGIPGEFALYDIIMEHFGPDAPPTE